MAAFAMFTFGPAMARLMAASRVGTAEWIRVAALFNSLDSLAARYNQAGLSC